MTTQLRLICQFQNVLDNPRNFIEVPGPVCVLTLDSESPRCRIETESPPTKSRKICPVASMRKRQREDHQNASDASIGTDQAFYVVFLNRAENGALSRPRFLSFRNDRMLSCRRFETHQASDLSKAYARYEINKAMNRSTTAHRYAFPNLRFSRYRYR